MTGKSILEAMSFVDEAYVEEAETGTIRPVLQVRKLLPMAACLCAALLGLFTLKDILPRQETTAADAEMQMETAPETIVMDKTQSVLNGNPKDAAENEEAPQISEAPCVILRIESWNDNGFTAIVEQIADSEAFTVGQTVQVAFFPNACMEVVEEDLVTVTRQMPSEEYFPVGSLVLVRYVYISDDTGIIHAEAISLAPET